MNKDDDTNSWFLRLRHFLHIEPQNKEQLLLMLRDAQVRKLMDEETLAMIEGALIFSQMQVRDIMLPKQQMTFIEQHARFEDIVDIITQSGHSRFPVLNDSNDQVIGILHGKDLLRFQTKEQRDAFDLLDILRQPTFIPESQRLSMLLSDFRTNRNHMAIVVDEYGSFMGFVTLEDLIEQIIGDIADEFDIDEEAYIKHHGDAHYIIKAYTPIEEFNQQLGAHFSDEIYDTIGGIVLARLGHLPKRGETITIDEFQFKIINSNARRINLLECFDQRSSSNDSQSTNTTP